MRIAYVEDNPTNLALVERVASMNQHIIVSYLEGEVAKQELLKEKFDLILMDVELAGEISGLQVVRHLRLNGLQTPIVAVTAYAMLGDQERCLAAGCNDYLPKPLPIMDLLALLNRYDALIKEGVTTPVPMPREVAESVPAAAGNAMQAPAPAPVPAPPAAPVAPVQAAPAPTAEPAAPPASPAPETPAAPAAPASVAAPAPATPEPAAPAPTPAPSQTAAPSEAAAVPAPVPAPAETASAPASTPMPTSTPTPTSAQAPVSPPVTPAVSAEVTPASAANPARPDEAKPA